ncbi:hypothetical protein N7510_002318 [Penicillium lagena]|uniref:uncharacterized protein n=1 Tax=Penicillium lagena TaxID=94218 RepID=UPI00253FC437|nr:uncharacterized protein N7510_002318 [Penicillium lagena]KAJ5626009.1 hypothetical protein N7510_002318 [Penicillium lagena]
MQVTGCSCLQSGVAAKCPLLAPQCNSPTAPNEVVPISPFNGGQLLWGQGCIDANVPCNACYIWFGSLCRCLKNSADCTLAQPNVVGDPIWALLSNKAAHGLITTSQKLPGILQLKQAPEPNRGWQLGQSVLRNPPTTPAQYTRKTGALAMNSVSTRTEEQIHIHVCNNPTSVIRTILSRLPRAGYTQSTLVPLPLGFPAGSELRCQISPQPGMDINVANAILKYLGPLHSYGCEQFRVGAGLIIDNYDYTWACVTTGTRGAEDLFCRL